MPPALPASTAKRTRRDWIGGLAGTGACLAGGYHFWPERYLPPLKHPLLNQTVLVCVYGNRANRFMGMPGQYSLPALERQLQGVGGRPAATPSLAQGSVYGQPVSGQRPDSSISPG